LTTLAVHTLHVHYSGVASHAAAAPHLGRNALDAAVLGYVNVAALRQHIRSDERVHGVFPSAGEQPNIVPSTASAHWYVRASTTERLEELKERVVNCLAAGALAAGCVMDLNWVDPAYSEMSDNDQLLSRYQRNAEFLGRPFEDPEVVGYVTGSTDMGNLSQVMPTIHPLIAVAPPGVSIHTPEFAAYARSEAGDRAEQSLTAGSTLCEPEFLSSAATEVADLAEISPLFLLFAGRVANVPAEGTYCGHVSSLVPTYVAEQFTEEEQVVLRRYFSSLDGPVFALVNLPEVVKGALFARYSRSAKSLRRLFVDEFVGELDTTGDESVDATIGLDRAEALYDRIFFEYGDDSVAQLGGVHLACEQASNLLTKILDSPRFWSGVG
ncbi:MAG: peptidase dimerization domain-containing protein, partial [Actinobacteria bacterium]|nr:peptidase dimerization domain-containing protein [Actinomycetota bacterium]